MSHRLSRAGKAEARGADASSHFQECPQLRGLRQPRSVEHRSRNHSAESSSRFAAPKVTRSERNTTPSGSLRGAAEGTPPPNGGSRSRIRRRVFFVTRAIPRAGVRSRRRRATPSRALPSAPVSPRDISSSELCELRCLTVDLVVDQGSASGPSQHLTLARVQPPGCHRVYPLIHSPHMAHGHPTTVHAVIPRLARLTTGPRRAATRA
jgi:hypothetical protein